MKHLFISVIALAILYGYSVYSYAGNQQNSANSGNVTSVVLNEFAIEEDTTPTPNPDQPKEDDTEGMPDPDQPKEDDTEGTPDPDQPKEDDTEGTPDPDQPKEDDTEGTP